jgi:hypothetical protein
MSEAWEIEMHAGDQELVGCRTVKNRLARGGSLRLVDIESDLFACCTCETPLNG